MFFMKGDMDSLAFGGGRYVPAILFYIFFNVKVLSSNKL